MRGAVILAAGKASRYGRPKVLEKVLGRPVLFYAVEAFRGLVEKIVVVVPEGLEDEYSRIAGDVDAVVAGGETRAESAAAGIAALNGCDVVLVHDGARPAVPRSDIARLLDVLRESHAAALVYPLTETIKVVRNGHIVKTIPREGLHRALTPQGFRIEAYQRIRHKVKDGGADEAWLFEQAGIHPVAVPADGYNPKLTYRRELRLIEALLED